MVEFIFVFDKNSIFYPKIKFLHTSRYLGPAIEDAGAL